MLIYNTKSKQTHFLERSLGFALIGLYFALIIIMKHLVLVLVSSMLFGFYLYEGESNINGNFAVDCTKHVRT